MAWFLYQNPPDLIEYQTYDTQKIIIDHEHKRIYTKINTATSSLHYNVLEVGINEKIIKKILSTGYTLVVYLAETGKNFSITADILKNFIKINLVVFKCNDVTLAMLPLLIFDEERS